MLNITPLAVPGIDAEARQTAHEALNYASLHETKISQLGTAALTNVGIDSGEVIALDAEGRLPPVDGSRLLNLPTTGGFSSNEENEAIVDSRRYLRIDPATMTVVRSDDPAVPPAPNHVLAASAAISDGATIATDNVELLGMPAVEITQPGGIYGADAFIARLPTPIADGAAFVIALLFSPAEDPGGQNGFIQLRVDTSAGYVQSLDLDYASGTIEAKFLDHHGIVCAGTSGDAANNYVLDLGGGVYLAKVRLVFGGAGDLVPGSSLSDIKIGAVRSGQNHSGTVVVKGLYAGASDYEWNANDGREALLLPDVADTVTLTLASSGGYQKALAVAAPSTLALPPPPTAGVREHLVRVSFDGGSLAMPSSGVTLFANSPGPFTNDLQLAVVQYSDGSPAAVHVIEAA